MLSITRRQALAAGVGVLPFLAGRAALAQVETAPGGMAVKAGSRDPILAADLLIVGNKQIQICRWALARTQNADVRNFANAEIQEHEGIRQSLEQLGFRYPVSDMGNTAAIVAAGIPPDAAPEVAIEHQVAMQWIATAESELGFLKGIEFDKRFIGSQLDAHYSLYDHALVFRRYASPQLVPVLDKDRPIIEQHIGNCKRILVKLDQTK